jgi:hypothetical protein
MHRSNENQPFEKCRDFTRKEVVVSGVWMVLDLVSAFTGAHVRKMLQGASNLNRVAKAPRLQRGN